MSRSNDLGGREAVFSKPAWRWRVLFASAKEASVAVPAIG